VVGLRGLRGCLLPLEPVDQVVGRDRPADVVALDGVAAERVQRPPGGLVLDPFGDDPQADADGDDTDTTDGDATDTDETDTDETDADTDDSDSE